jgi:hypothetical protein
VPDHFSTKKETRENFRKHIAEIAARPEHKDPQIQVQHLLISFKGAGTDATRSKEAAEKEAAALWERAAKGEDFDALVKKYTDDAHPGIYGMTAALAPRAILRAKSSDLPPRIRRLENHPPHTLPMPAAAYGIQP